MESRDVRWAMSEKKAKSARVRKSDGAELYALTVRLPPKLKYGLDLLARLHGRPLNQAIEWALQFALANVRADGGEVGSEPTTFASVVDMTSRFEGWERAYWLYKTNPALVSFEERHACRILNLSDEWLHLVKLMENAKGTSTDAAGWQLDCWWLVVADVWEHLINDAAELLIAPNLEGAGVSLTELFYEIDPGVPIGERITMAAEQARARGGTERVQRPELPLILCRGPKQYA
jgi:hypothetical protein